MSDQLTARPLPYTMIIPGAEPFYFPGGSTGCLLIHGFTGTPKEMRFLGEYLAEKGYTVLSIRLCGHATHPRDLKRTRWQDWVASVEDGYEMLINTTDSIILMGLSMGGNLSLLFSTIKSVSGVVAMSTPYALPNDPRLPFAKYLGWIIPSVSKGPPDWRNPEAASDHIDYPYYPTRAIAELRDLVLETRKALPKVHVPVLLVHSKEDESVPPENMQQIYSYLGSADKQLLWVENCGHVIIREPERLQIFEAIDDFIHRLDGPNLET